ncbi:MAG TPA: ABC transporter permease [Micromonosporaceae bacterium]
MTDTAVANPDSAHSLRALAQRHGLRASGRRPGIALYARQLWAYRHFIAAFANARLAATYAKARLGQLWQVLTPLTNAAVYYLIFGVVINTRHGVDNFIAYLCTGIFVFGYTQQAVLAGTKSMSDNLALIRALHFPRAALPISVTLTQLQQVGVSIFVLAGIVVATGERPTLRWLVIVPALLLQSLFNAGMALAFARLGTKVSDLKQIMPFVLRTWLYASGVFYSVTNFISHLPPVMAKVMLLNPALVYIDLIRYALMESPQLSSPLPQLWLIGGVWAVVIGVLGFIYFWRGEQEYGRG